LRAAFTVNMSARIGHDVQSVTLLWERWVRVGGQWYYLPEKAAKPGPSAAPQAH